MKKAWLLLFLVVGLFLACQTGYENGDLIGDWGVGGTVVLSFSADTLTTHSGYMTTAYHYVAHDGAGEYWAEDYSAARVPFSYVLAGNTLNFTVSNMTLTLSRI